MADLSYEACQFNDWAPWHAIATDEKRTLCGRRPRHANRFIGHEFVVGRMSVGECETCVRIINKLRGTVRPNG